MRTLEFELGKIADFIVNQMFKVQPNETVVITSDTTSNHDVVNAIGREVHRVNGRVVIMQTPRFKGRVKLVDKSISPDLFVQAISHADIWIDANSNDFLYSETWEHIMAANKTLRYILLGDLSTEIMAKIYGAYDLPLMIELCRQIKSLVQSGKKMRVTNPQGTDLEFELEPNHIIAIDSGEINKPGLFTPPALVNIVPRFNSTNGVITFDAMYDTYPDKIMESPLRLEIKNSIIVEATGNRYAQKFMDTLNGWNDLNAMKVAHMNFGLLPTIREMIGHIVIDERVWGILNWGFGSVSPLDAPPHGQPSDYHIDAMCTDASVWIDDTQITQDGEFIHPVLKELANKL